MKKISITLIAMLLVTTGVFAQGQMDALRFSREDLFGTARSMSMGGAFGALGGDQTGISINPAGIAVYRSSEVVGTFGLMRTNATVGSEQNHRSSFNMDNIGFVAFMPLRSEVMPLINFGFSMNQQKSFNRNINASGYLNSSLLDFIAVTSSGLDPFHLEFADGRPDPFRSQPWLSVMAHDGGLIVPQRDGQNWNWSAVNVDAAGRGEAPFSQIDVRERGFIENFSFTMGTTINNVLNIGAALSVKTISYRLDSYYDEDFSGGGFTLRNLLSVDGAGAGGRFGIIYRPIHEVRIGLAYHTPTWLSLRETYSASMYDDMEYYTGWEPGGISSGQFSNDFNLRTPGRWVFSLATVLNNNLIVSVDYEIMNYRHMQLALPQGVRGGDGWFDRDNEFIQEDFRTASTVRLGMEYRFTPQFSGRLGYAWMQNPNNSTFRDSGHPLIAGSNSIFRVEGDTHFLTAGLGYRFNRNFFIDFALVYTMQTDDLYAFPNFWGTGGNLIVDATPFELRNTSLRGALTLGYRF
jgi:long-subunit fatty acid transport protein